MKVVEVIPIVKGITKATLSYFSKDIFFPGNFVKIPVRNGVVLGIVERSTDAKQKKSLLKTANFPLKKITLAEGSSLSRNFMKAVSETANFYAVSEGSVLSALVPKFYLENPSLIKMSNKKKSDVTPEIKIIQLGEEERIREYRSIIRESFAKGYSVLYISPTKKDAFKAIQGLSTGIENYVYDTTNKTPGALKKLLTKVAMEKHPILFITTCSHLVFDRSDLKTIILEKENSRAYRSLSRPFIDYKVFIKYYAEASDKALILGDSVLSLESLWLEKEGRVSEATPLTWRLKESATGEIIDMRAKKEFEVISEKVLNAIKLSLTENRKVFLFGARKGLSTTTVCGDCGSLLLCKNCSSPLILYKQHVRGEDMQYYKCHQCSAKRSAETRCDSCDSWKLNPLGIGIDTIAEECKIKIPEVQVFLVDKDHTPTKAKAEETVRLFNETPQSILIGTELAFDYLDRLSLVCAVSLDSLFSIPNFYINERIFYLITRLKEIATDRFMIQTRNVGKDILEWATAGNILDFYRSEIEEREDLHYPPFSCFIKVSVEDSKENIEVSAVKLKEIFASYNPHFTISKREVTKEVLLSMVLRVSRSSWPERGLLEKLLLLTPNFLIKVDPESIF